MSWALHQVLQGAGRYRGDKGSGFRVEGSGFRVLGLEFRDRGLGYRV